MTPRSAAAVFAPALILLSSFLGFVTHGQYRLLAPEILISGGLLLAIGLALGLLGRRSPWLGAAILAITLLFFADVQVSPSFTVLLALAVPLVLLCRLLGENLAVICSAIFATIAVLVVVSPTPPPPAVRVAGDEAAPAPGLPVVVHLLLDEHAGVEGLPLEIEGASAIGDQIRSQYVENGFRLYGRAFSPFDNTYVSVAHAMNYASDFRTGLVRRSRSGRFTYELTRNRYLADAQSEGYRVSVYQPDHVDVCSTEDVQVHRCHTYPAASISSIQDLEIPALSKVRVITSMYLARSQIYQKARNRYNWLVQGRLGLPLPEWNWDRSRVGPIPVMAVLDELERRLAEARPGDFFYAHLLIPHHPYIYDAECKPATDPAGWLNNEARLWGAPNTQASRADRYRRYFAQVACTNRRIDGILDALEASGQLDRAIVVIHGDHGARISLSPVYASHRDRLTPADYRDNFSTLFAVRAPGVTPGYDRDPWPVGGLLGDLKKAGFRKDPAFAGEGDGGTVYLWAQSPEDVVAASMPAPPIPTGQLDSRLTDRAPVPTAAR